MPRLSQRKNSKYPFDDFLTSVTSHFMDRTQFQFADRHSAPGCCPATISDFISLSLRVAVILNSKGRRAQLVSELNSEDSLKRVSFWYCRRYPSIFRRKITYT